MPRKGRAPGGGSCGPDPSPACTDGLAPPGGQAKAPREMLTWARDQDGHPDAPWGARWGGGAGGQDLRGGSPSPLPPRSLHGGRKSSLACARSRICPCQAPSRCPPCSCAPKPPALGRPAAPPRRSGWAGEAPDQGAQGSGRRQSGPGSSGGERERDIPGRSGDNTDSGGGAGRGGGGGVQAPVAQGSSGAKLSRKETHISQVSLAGPTAGAGMVAASGRHPPWSPAR